MAQGEPEAVPEHHEAAGPVETEARWIRRGGGSI
jgi:hypothetical protein